MASRDTILVTGGAGFIGANFVLNWAESAGTPVVNLDLLTYAGNPASLECLQSRDGHRLVHGDICNGELVGSLLREHRPRAVIHFAAESHVDRSIVAPDAFVRTDAQGTFTLLEQAKAFWSELDETDKRSFRFLMFRPTRCTARWVQTILRFMRDAVCAEQSLCRIKGGVGSPGAGISP